MNQVPLCDGERVSLFRFGKTNLYIMKVQDLRLLV